MTVVMVTYCECKKISSVLLNKTNIKADSFTYADELYSYKEKNVCKHSGKYYQSSHILESLFAQGPDYRSLII